MRYLLLFFVALFSVDTACGQSLGGTIINAAGSTFIQRDMIYEWSVGEVAIVETMENPRLSITNGFLQPINTGFFTNNVYKVFPINMLTPNGDGVNDVWIVKDIEKYPDNEITVFDRSGRIVFHVINYQNDWMGYLNGKPLIEDTYYYIIKLRKNSKVDHLKGFITIVN